MTQSDPRLVMLVAADAAQCRTVTTLAARDGWRTLVVGSASEAERALTSPEGGDFKAIILDEGAPDQEPCAAIRRFKALRPDLPLVMLTVSTSPELAVEAMRSGASDYLVKPVDGERLIHALSRSDRSATSQDELQPLAEKLEGELDFDAMVGTAAPFRTALAKAATAARGHGHALIEGEAGTGKEMLMRAMHSASPRAKAPMRLVNCGGIPAQSLASLMFGHEKGAFPGAFNRQAGLLQHCDGGTLVLADIDRMDPLLQVRLAEVLESGIVRPTGAAHGYRIDVRVLAASDLPLDELAAAGEFDASLFAQLSATRVHLPPLRERLGDVPALTRHFLSRIAEQPGLTHHSIADSGLTLLEAYDWPGNVRQLQAVLFRAAVFCEEEALTAVSFPQLAEIIGDHPDRGESRARGLGVLLYTEDGHLRPLEEIERDIIRLAIGHYRGRMTEVARRLGIGRSTLYRKLAELGIDNAA